MTATIPVGLRPQDLAINSLSNKLYVANSEGNTISVVDASTNKVIDTIGTGNFPRGFRWTHYPTRSI